MAVNFPTGWGLRINLTAAMPGEQVYHPDDLLALLPAGVSWAHWGPVRAGHTVAGWSPCVPVFGERGGVINYATSLMDAPDGSCFLLGNDQQQEGDDLDIAIARQADQLDAVRNWSRSTGRLWGWAGPQWRIETPERLEQLARWLHLMRQRYGYPRPHRLAIHVYARSVSEFWQAVDGFDAWRADKLPGVRVLLTEFSGWPGTPEREQQAIMAAGREYLNREHVDWAAWFSGFPFFWSGTRWGTELARLDGNGDVGLTALGERWLALA